jgi:Mg2+ and Co2+ transporter CorA
MREDLHLTDIDTIHVAHILLDALIDTDVPVVNSVQQDLDAVEAAVYQIQKSVDKSLLLKQIVALRQNLLNFTTIVNSKEDVLFNMVTEEFLEKLGLNISLAYFRDLFDRMQCVSRELKAYVDLVQVLEKTYLAMISIRLTEKDGDANYVQVAMACAAIIFLPIESLSLIFGIQVPIPYQFNNPVYTSTKPFWTISGISFLFSLTAMFLLKFFKVI